MNKIQGLVAARKQINWSEVLFHIFLKSSIYNITNFWIFWDYKNFIRLILPKIRKIRLLAPNHYFFKKIRKKFPQVRKIRKIMTAGDPCNFPVQYWLIFLPLPQNICSNWFYLTMFHLPHIGQTKHQCFSVITNSYKRRCMYVMHGVEEYEMNVIFVVKIIVHAYQLYLYNQVLLQVDHNMITMIKI